MGGGGRNIVARENHRDTTTNQLGRHGLEPIPLAVGEPVLDRDVLALDIADLPQAFSEPRKSGIESLRTEVEISNRWLRRLRTASNRPCYRRAPKNGDELAASHVLPSISALHPIRP
jgi:hypothetical protein